MNGLEEKTGLDFVHINQEQLILELAPGRQQKMRREGDIGKLKNLFIAIDVA